MLDKILLKLAALIADRIIDHTDEIAAAVATAVTREVLDAISKKVPDLTDLENLPDQLGKALADVFNKVPIFGGLFNGFFGNK